MRAEIAALRDLTPDIREFALRPDGGAPSYPPGAHLEVSLDIRGRRERRHYSLVGPARDGLWRIAVRRAESGHGGSLAMWALKLGDQIEISAPLNRFALSREAADYLLVAGGIGVTPLVGMAQALAARGAAVRMVYAGRSLTQMAYRDELSATLGDRLTLFADDEGQWLDLTAAFATLDPDGEAYVCGPAPMLAAAQEAWRASGRPAAKLRFESFGGGGGQPFAVRLPRFDREIDVPADQTMLEALEAAGIEMMWGCRRGECGLCAVEVLSADGPIDHRDQFFSARQKEEGRKLCACVSRLAGGVVAIDTAYRGAPGST